MPRRNFADGMEITFNDLNKITSSLEKQLYDRILFRFLQEKSDRVFGGSFLVTRVSATSVSVAAGLGIQTDATVLEPEPQKRLLYLAAAEALSIATPDVTNPRIDIVCIKHNRENSETASRKYKAPTSGTITTETLTVETDWKAALVITTGTPAGSPVAPAVPAGYIKIAELVVTALTGIAASGAITDTRVKVAYGPEMLVDTTGYTKITAGVETKLTTILANIDTALASGGGGGGGMVWTPSSENGALEAEEHGRKVFLFPDATDSEVIVDFLVPAGYVAGTPVSVYLGFFSPSAANGFQMKTTTTLIRKNLDPVDSTTNTATSTVAFTNTVAKMFRRGKFALTSVSGTINAVAVAAGDVIKIKLTRDHANAADTDTDDIRFIPSTTEPSLS